jgi:hypothetical protein
MIATNFSSKIYYGLCVFVIILASLIFASRGALLAIVISLILGLAGLLVFHMPRKFFFTLLLVLLAGLAVGGLALRISRPTAISSIGQTVDNNTITRLAAWQISLKGIVQHPLLGSGPGTFALFFEHNRPQSMASVVGVFDDPHNLFLRMAAAEGVPFVLLFLGLLIVAGYFASVKLKREKDLLTLGCLVGVVAWCVGTSFNPVPIPMFMLLAILLAGLLVDNTESKTFNLSPGVKWTGYIFASVLIIFGVILVASEYVFGFAKIYYSNQDYQADYRLSILAERLNPTNPLYEVYRIGGEIGLNKNPGVIDKDIQRLTTIHSTQADTYVGASNLYNILYSSTGQKIYLQGAVSEMNKALKLDSLFAERYGQVSLYYYELGDLKASKSAVEKNLVLDDSQFAPWVLLAKIYQTEGEKTQTIYALTKAFELRPDILQLEYLIHLAKTEPDIKNVPIQVATQSGGLE